MKSQKTNIVLIVSDDHGREALGCYGNPVIKTPHLDQLAQDGTRFTQAFCTTPSCAASRSVMLTGCHNHTNGTYGHTHDRHHFACFDDVITLPRLLNESGYRTATIGKKHYAPESVYAFQEQLGEYDYGRDDVRMANACSDFVSSKEEPFFLYWCSYNPHRTGNIKEDHPLKPKISATRQTPSRETRRKFTAKTTSSSHWLPDTPETRAELCQYYQSISRLDRGIGRPLKSSKNRAPTTNTDYLHLRQWRRLPRK